MFSFRPALIKINQSRFSLTKFFWLGQLFLFIFAIILSIVPSLLPFWSRFGRLMANLSVLAFILSLLPGIFRRLQAHGLFQDLQLILMLFRRQFGLAMYLFAFYHYLFSRIFPTLKFNGNLLAISPFELFGFIAFLLTTPLFLTSNDQSQRRLGRRWGQLHRLVYIIIWLIVIHIALQLKFGPTLILLIITAITQTFSLLRH